MKLKNIAFSLVVTLVSAGAACAAVEWLVPERLIRPSFQMSGYKIYFDPRVLYRIESSTYGDINSKGYRNAEFASSKEGRRRILFLGDSVTMGANVKPEETAPAVLGKLLGPEYEVLNMGIFGYGPDQSLIQILDEGLALEPDGVLLGINPSNDFNDIAKNMLITMGKDGRVEWSPGNPVAQAVPDSKLLYALDYVRFRLGRDGEKYLNLFRMLLGDGYDWRLLTQPEEDLSKLKMAGMAAVLRRIGQELSARGIPFLVVIYPTYEAYQGEEVFQAFNQPAEKRFFLETLTEMLCHGAGVKYLSLYHVFEQQRPSYLIFEDSNGHPGPEGFRDIAAYIHSFLKSDLMKDSGWKV